MGAHPEKDPRKGYSIPSHSFATEECGGLGPEGVTEAKLELHPGKIHFTLPHPLVQLGTVLEIIDYVNFLGSNRKSS